MASAIFRFTRIRDDRHRLLATVDGAVLADVTLESRSFLVHDLAHYAVEAAVPLAMGFWGHLASGTSLEQLSQSPMTGTMHPDLVAAEGLSATFQSRWADRMPRARWMEMAAEALPGRDVGALHDDAMERMRTLVGAWKATNVGNTLVLQWPPHPPRVEP